MRMTMPSKTTDKYEDISNHDYQDDCHNKNECYMSEQKNQQHSEQILKLYKHSKYISLKRMRVPNAVLQYKP